MSTTSETQQQAALDALNGLSQLVSTLQAQNLDAGIRSQMIGQANAAKVVLREHLSQLKRDALYPGDDLDDVWSDLEPTQVNRPVAHIVQRPTFCGHCENGLVMVSFSGGEVGYKECDCVDITP